MGTPLGPKCILDTPMAPLGPKCILDTPMDPLELFRC